MTNVTIETVAPINPYALDESEIEEIIDDLKDSGVEPTYTFEKWSQHPFDRSYIHAWLLRDLGVEVYEVGSDAHYTSPGADTLGENGEFDKMVAVDLFLRCGIYEGDESDPLLIANILGGESIRNAKPDEGGPVILLSVTDYDGGGQSVTRWWEKDEYDDDGRLVAEGSKTGEYDSYADAQAQIDEEYLARGDHPLELGYGVIAIWHKIIPLDWELAED